MASRSPIPKLLLFSLLAAAAASSVAARPITSEGLFPLHLQGICRAPTGELYWSWTDAIAKTDTEGRLLARVPADNHQGDLCYHAGRVYVAVNLGKSNRPLGEEDSWVYVFDGASLELLELVE